MESRTLTLLVVAVTLAALVAGQSARAGTAAACWKYEEPGVPASCGVDTPPTDPLLERLLLAAPPAAARGKLLFEDGFDRRTFANWTHIQVSCRHRTPDSLIEGFVPGLRQGRYAARFRLRHGIRSDAASGNEACEVTRKRNSYRLGRTEFYGMRFRIAGPYTPSAAFAMTHQLAYPTVRWMPIGTHLGNTIRLRMLTGEFLGATFEHTDDRRLATISPGRWHEFVWKVTWATAPTGGITIWHRLNGRGTWKQVYRRAGIPTQQWGRSPYGCVTQEGTNCHDGGPRITLDKIGAYRGFNPAGQQDLVVDHDVFIVGSSFGAIAAALARR